LQSAGRFVIIFL